MLVSEQLRTYPSPNTTLFLTCFEQAVVGSGNGRAGGSSSISSWTKLSVAWQGGKQCYQIWKGGYWYKCRSSCAYNFFLPKLFYPTGQVHRHQEDSSSQHSASFSTKKPQELTLLNKPVFFLLLWKKNRGHLLMTSTKKLFNRNLIFYDGKLTDWS